MILYKKVVGIGFQEYILTLSSFGPIEINRFGQCKIKEATILEAERLDGGYTPYKAFYSLYDSGFVYRVNQKVQSQTGIYCFATRKEARDFMSPKKEGKEKSMAGMDVPKGQGDVQDDAEEHPGI